MYNNIQKYYPQFLFFAKLIILVFAYRLVSQRIFEEGSYDFFFGSVVQFKSLGTLGHNLLIGDDRTKLAFRNFKMAASGRSGSTDFIRSGYETKSFLAHRFIDHTESNWRIRCQSIVFQSEAQITGNSLQLHQ